MNTLADYFDYNLNILSIGLNPSTVSVKQGYYFANPRNRFWKALNNSGLLDESLEPSVESQQLLFEKYKIGFTDVVKRSTAMGKDLKVADFKKYAPLLRLELEKFQPKICWFHGKVAMKNYLKYAHKDIAQEVEVVWGKQRFLIADAVVFVTPNPSPANASFSLEVITDWYKKLYNAAI